MINLPDILKQDFLAKPFDTFFDGLERKLFPFLEKDFGCNVFSNSAYPKMDIKEYDDKVKIVAEIPAVSKENVQITVQDGDNGKKILKISGKHQEEKESENFRYSLHELKKSKFQRTIVLNDNVDADKIGADFNEGRLTITIPKREIVDKPQIKQINIK